MLFRNGDFVPVEVKRTFSSVVPAEVEKLERLSAALRSLWSAIAVCQYGYEAPEDFAALESRDESTDPFRIILSYDALLTPMPFWSLGSETFAWVPLSEEQVSNRQADFVTRMSQQAKDCEHKWLESAMIRRPKNMPSDTGTELNNRGPYDDRRSDRRAPRCRSKPLDRRRAKAVVHSHLLPGGTAPVLGDELLDLRLGQAVRSRH